MTITPSKEEFLKLAGKGNLIPVYAEILADAETPVSAYQKLQKTGPSFLLESVEGGEWIGRYSFLGTNPRTVIRVDQRGGDDALRAVELEMAKFKPVSVPGLPRFTGGAVGFLGYEYIHQTEPTVKRPDRDDLKTPTLCFMITDTILIFDRVSQTIKIVSNAHVEKDAGAAYDGAVAQIESLLRQLAQPLAVKPLEFRRDAPPVKIDSNMTKDRYAEMIRQSKEYIKAGDIIQTVLAQRFQTQVKASPLDIYRALRSVNPSPYMFLLDFGDFQLVGASPEVHVRCEDRHVEIRPIAGTRWRGKTVEEDLALEKELLADEKERAEHLMLVDLARNDIGRVCDFGSVKVDEFMIVERYSHVMHIVSNVSGKLQAERNSYDLMRATFPAGTVSGAPKVRAMQIISDLEATQRGPYAGAVGYFSFSGNLDSCITLRTATLKNGTAYVQAGGGIVADSDAGYEFNETVNKAKAMFKAIALAESFREPSMGILDLLALAYVAYGVFRGRKRGLETELPGALSLAIFFVTGTGLYRWTDKLLAKTSVMTGQSVGVTTFVGMWVAAILLVRHFRGRIGGWTKGRFDAGQRHRWGMAAGGVRAALLVCIVLLVLAHWPLHGLTRGFVAGSAIGRGLVHVVLPVYEKTHSAL